MGKFDRFAFSASPTFDEAATRVAFSKAVPLKTLIICCYDPRAAEIPSAVVKLLANEEYPGHVVVDDAGNRVAHTTTIFPIIVAGGRAVDALRSITVAQHLFGIENSWSSITRIAGRQPSRPTASSRPTERSTTPDISALYDRGSICIEDYEASLKSDCALIRAHAGTPKHVNIRGCFYDIDTGMLTEVDQRSSAGGSMTATHVS